MAASSAQGTPYGCPFRGACCVNCLCVLVQPCRNRPAEFARCSRCPPVACQRRWLPLPVSVMLIFRCFPVQTVNLIFYGVLQAGGGVHPRSITSSVAMSKPSGGIRSLHSLSACGLPTPVVALACIGHVDIQAFFLCKRSTLFCTAFASLCIKPPLKGEGNRR